VWAIAKKLGYGNVRGWKFALDETVSFTEQRHCSKAAKFGIVSLGLNLCKPRLTKVEFAAIHCLDGCTAACAGKLIFALTYALCRYKLNFLNALALTLSRREREF
jgi:hypothetical protein